MAASETAPSSAGEAEARSVVSTEEPSAAMPAEAPATPAAAKKRRRSRAFSALRSMA
jgi:hypothetical protein